MAKNKIRSIELVEVAPRPASGDGDVVVAVGDSAVVLRWAGEKIVNVEAMEGGSDALSFFDLEMKMPEGGGDDGSLGIVLCKKCATDTATGQTVCWPVDC